ncbi:MAG: TRAP transporter large permease [Desulfomonile tiedjei]|nr:TRAP transporter large permease [Desulfomonile tiedjei]
MSEVTLSVVVFLSALIVLFSGIPIWTGLTGISLVYIVIFSPRLLDTVPHVLYGSMDSFAMLSIPLFILLSAPLSVSRASKDLYEAMHRWVYRLPGGLGVSTMMAGGVFAALCGSSPATAAAIGGVGIPEMRRRGYSPSMACAMVAHAGTFGILIPPSITMILYGVATETSIGRCFIAGVIPGILLVVMSSLWIIFYFAVLARKKATPVKTAQSSAQSGPIEHFTLKEQLESLVKVSPLILIIVGIMVSLYGGWATPSEAAGVGAVIAIIVVMVVYKFYQVEGFVKMLTHALNDSTMILMIMAAATLFGFVCSDLYVTQSLAEMILQMPLGKWGIMLFVNLLLLLLGCFIPPAAIVLMTAPMLLPVIKGLGLDPVWFSVIMTVNLEVGLLTPPVGLNLYVVQGIAPDVPLAQVLWDLVPFLILDLILIVLLCAFPELALWLPAKMMG